MIDTWVDREELGNRLRSMMWWLDESFAEVSSATGIPDRTLRRWFAGQGGKGLPPKSDLAKLAEHFVIALEDLLDASYDMRVWFNGRT